MAAALAAALAAAVVAVAVAVSVVAVAEAAAAALLEIEETVLAGRGRFFCPYSPMLLAIVCSFSPPPLFINQRRPEW